MQGLPMPRLSQAQLLSSAPTAAAPASLAATSRTWLPPIRLLNPPMARTKQMCRHASGFAAPRGAPKPQLDLTPPMKNLPLPRITTAHRLARWQLERRTVGSCTRWCTSAWPNVMLGEGCEAPHAARDASKCAQRADGDARGGRWPRGGCQRPCCQPCCASMGSPTPLCWGIACS